MTLRVAPAGARGRLTSRHRRVALEDPVGIKGFAATQRCPRVVCGHGHDRVRQLGVGTASANDPHIPEVGSPFARLSSGATAACPLQRLCQPVRMVG
jgi:hypothetical protein